MKPKVKDKQSKELNNENVFQCDSCQYKCLKEGYLKRHKRLYSTCDDCHTSFGCFSQLREHRKVNLYSICDDCHTSFGCSSQLRDHRKVNCKKYKVSTLEEAWEIRRRWIEENCSPEEMELAARTDVLNTDSDYNVSILKDFITTEKDDDINTVETVTENVDNINEDNQNCDDFCEPDVDQENRYYNKPSQLKDYLDFRIRELTKNKAFFC